MHLSRIGNSLTQPECRYNFRKFNINLIFQFSLDLMSFVKFFSSVQDPAQDCFAVVVVCLFAEDILTNDLLA